MLDLFEPRCTCPDFEHRQAACKHVYAVQYVIEREQTADGQTVVTETVKVTRKTYSQNWGAYNAAQTKEKSEIQALLYELCKGLPEPMQRTGRPRLSLSDIIFRVCSKFTARYPVAAFQPICAKRNSVATSRACLTTTQCFVISNQTP